MNPNENAIKPLESNPVSLKDLPERTNSRLDIEPCEFERLLEHAVEILGIRAQIEAASRS